MLSRSLGCPRVRRETFQILASGLLLILVSGCATAGGLRSEPLDAGISRVFDAPLDETLTASREAVVEAGLRFESAQQVGQDTWVIMAKKETSAFSWGELVRVVVRPEPPEATWVSVLTRRRLATNVTAKGDYSESILSNIQLKLR